MVIINELNTKISKLVQQIKQHFNPFWGELMRAGAESPLPTKLKNTHVYMERFSDFNEYTSDFYFRPLRRYLPHELDH